MPRGGYHPNAERWGRKSAWQSSFPTKTTRLPENLIEQVLDYAHKLDSGELIDYETKAKNEIERLQQELAACRASQPQPQPQPQPQQLDLEAIRDRVLAELKLGRQAPGYKAALKVLNRFIALIQSV